MHALAAFSAGKGATILLRYEDRLESGLILTLWGKETHVLGIEF
jgi:hypothetical protein